MEQLLQLLNDLEEISLQDISQVPDSQQHILVERIEELQDELRLLVESE
ncbi:hypothetical protein MSP8887_03961 [Marinomonas spartinae]|uniref:Uncharacterized protein n=1 Tax=Marinomonas spartinae TaxID=1792290 RepID=A0A1A8T2X8_9GAMM|nr:hypothetical protein [Marinomonas spartinae]SBS25702.1 hypothetical protein MSP8886_00360 [Marinomonas spartinae]SBS39706.1 hypothetical protein MSP8887_03961 [Marinomonas spartinae]